MQPAYCGFGFVFSTLFLFVLKHGSSRIQLCLVLNIINSNQSWGDLCCLPYWADTKQQYQVLVITSAFLKKKEIWAKNPNTPKFFGVLMLLVLPKETLSILNPTSSSEEMNDKFSRCCQLLFNSSSLPIPLNLHRNNTCHHDRYTAAESPVIQWLNIMEICGIPPGMDPAAEISAGLFQLTLLVIFKNETQIVSCQVGLSTHL